MKNLLPLLFLFTSSFVNAQNKYTQYVNPFVGTGGHGHTFPGATTPFAMVQLSPDTRIDGSWDGCSGYHYSDSLIYGFSHTHLSGTGCSDYGDISFLPVFVNKTFDKLWHSDTLHVRFSHATEKASPGYYSVILNKGQIKVELTSTTRVGLQKYTYQNNGYTWIFLDLKHRDELLEGKIIRSGPNSFQGMRRSKAWAHDQLLYYYFELNKAPESMQIDSSIVGHTRLKLGFNVIKGESIQIKTALSSVDESGAKLNLESELPHWDFAKVKKQAKQSWNKELSRIKAYGGSLIEKKNFYTALYHCMMHPNVMNDVDGRYRGRDKQVHNAEGYNHYTVFSLWDTYRALHPLLNIIDKKRSHDFIMTFKAQYEQSGRLPMWELWGNETNCMIGFHSVSVILDAYRKGVISYSELQSMYPAVKAEALSNRFGLDKFREKGYLSIEDESESVSKTLEYSYDMSCVAGIAFHLGNYEDHEKFSRYAHAWKNLYEVKSHFMVPRSNGGWIKDFDPSEVNNHFTEANAWQYAFAVQHDIEAIQTKNHYRLSGLFSADSKTTGREQSDITGLIGQYAHGNEPSHHVAYLFNNLDSTGKYVKKICKEFYKPEPDGLCGNEDCGQMSAWYVFSAMGFYPADPTGPYMYFGNMIFDSVRFVQGDGSAVIHRKAKQPDYYYASYIVEFGSESKYYFGYALPVAEGLGRYFTYYSAPVIEAPSEVFTDSMKLRIWSNRTRFERMYKVEPLIESVYYTLDGSEPDTNSLKYVFWKDINIWNSCTLKAYSVFNNGVVSKQSVAHFYKRPNNFNVDIKSVCNKQYDAGGKAAIIDGLKGDEDWRKGRWQGYQGQDFEAVIDMKKPVEFDTVILGFLQDKGSWIFLPDQVFLYGSDDSLNFTEISLVEFMNDDTNRLVKRYEMPLLNSKIPYKYRYLKIVATSFGKLPKWHPGSGGDSFIFIDEIEIR